MKEKASAKKKLIIILCIVAGLLLLIGSFFLRDLLIRSGFAEYDSKEVIQVKNKYSASLDAIVAEGEKGDFVIKAEHGGLFQKSVIIAEGESKTVYEKLKNNIDVLCHSYCYTITSEKGIVTFTFNQSATKKLIYSEEKPQKKNEKDILSDLDDDWYYYEEAMSEGDGESA